MRNAPLTAAEIEELRQVCANYANPNCGATKSEVYGAFDHLPRLLSMLTPPPPPDAEVGSMPKNGIELVKRLRSHFGTSRCGLKMGVEALKARAWNYDLALSDLREAIDLHTVQTPRLTEEQVEAIKDAKEVFSISGDLTLANRIEAAFPELFNVEEKTTHE